MSDVEIRTVVEALRSACDPCCVIVAGSAGTGELTTDREAGRVSDLEVAVVAPLTRLPAVRRARRRLTGCEVFWVAPWRLRRGMQRNLGPTRPNVMAFDLARQPRYGDLPRGSRPPRLWAAADLDLREALVLLGNRIAEHLEAPTSYTSVKVAVACGDALLVARGRYELGYERRLDRLRQDGGLLPAAIRQPVLDAYEAKLGRRPLTRIPPVTLSTLVGRTLQALGGPSPASEFDLVRWFAAQWQPTQVGWTSGVRDVAPKGLRAVRALGWRHTLRVLRSTTTPEPAIYAGLYRALLEGERQRPGPAAVTDAPVPGLRLWRAFCY